MTEFREISQRAWDVRKLYSAHETKLYGREWSKEEVMLGFVGDVGDLAKLAQAAAGIREIPDAKAKLAHELADCLWSVMTLARMHDVDLEAAFQQTMDEIEVAIEARSK